MNAATTSLLEHCQKAREVEGKTIRVLLPEGSLCILFQRDRKRDGRLEEGQIDSMLWRLWVEVNDMPPNTVSPDEAEALIAGMSIAEMHKLRQAKAALLFEQFKRIHQPRLIPTGWGDR